MALRTEKGWKGGSAEVANLNPKGLCIWPTPTRFCASVVVNSTLIPIVYLSQQPACMPQRTVQVRAKCDGAFHYIVLE